MLSKRGIGRFSGTRTQETIVRRWRFRYKWRSGTVAAHQRGFRATPRYKPAIKHYSRSDQYCARWSDRGRYPDQLQRATAKQNL